VAGSSEHRNEHLGFIKCRGFLDYTSISSMELENKVLGKMYGPVTEKVIAA
jgi:hypothetical protein